MYDHKQLENEVTKFWEDEKIHEKAKKKNESGTPWYFCDGPPYATGSIHPGTGWNKTMKDVICRYYRMRGYNVRAQAGYDTHGLPIEVKVEQELKIKNKNEIEKIGIEKFVKKCKEFATKYIQIMNKQFLSLGVWLDFENSYITYKDEYIEKSWKTIKKAWDRGLVHEGVYVLPYCYRCETTLANYELEYGDETDPSIYVKFKLKSDGKNNKNEYLLIWTTTPWTLVGNMAVMIHPTLTYVKAQIDDEIWIIAKDRLETILNMIGKSTTIIEEMSGKKLEGKRYEHPFQNRIKKVYDRRIVLSDEFVTIEEGTGLVHCAPGHGPEDFIIGKRFDIEIFSPVDEHGNYTMEAGDYQGRNVREASIDIIKTLKENGSLVYEQRIKHRYPHCWRCKMPLIFLTTKQWFITVSKIKDKMLDEIEKIEWYPDFAKQRFKEFVSAAPDWCISRQRYWGIPLPIWKCKTCKKTRVIGSRSELPKIKELHRPYTDEILLDCECGEKMQRIEDVLDVWFDSGNAVWASLSEHEIKTFGERADVILEGQDQIRGWFYSLLGSGIVYYDTSPYKRVVMHGFFVDEKGEKMSKSLGNFIPLEEILAKYGADTFRVWGLGNTIWEELKFNWEDLKKANSDLNIIYNIVVFLGRFYKAKKIENVKLNAEDKWLVSRTNTLVKEFNDSFKRYEMNYGVRALRNFIVEDISRFYMKIAKERIANNDNDEAALYSLYYATLNALKMLCIIAPFLSEHLYKMFFKKFEKEDSILLLRLDDEDSTRINISYEKEMEIIREICTVALNSRQEIKIKVRWPLRTLYIETKSHEINEVLQNFKDVLVKLVNVKDIKIIQSKPKEDVAEADFTNGKIYLEKKIDEELYEEGIVNEVKRRVQALRKTGNLIEKDTIEIRIDGDNEIASIVEKMKVKLMKEVNAKSIILEKTKEMEEYEIDGKILRVAIKKI